MKKSLSTLAALGLVVLACYLLSISMPSARSQPTATPTSRGPLPPASLLPPCESRIPISSLPFTIDECGSYFLTDCLVGEAGSHGITINAADVTIDLNGFTLQGVPNSLDGIHFGSATRRNVSVFNGTIQGWGGDGVDAFNGSSRDADRFKDMMIRNNAGRGLSLGGTSLVSSCTLEDNGQEGLSSSVQCTVVSSRAHLNGGNGIMVSTGSTVMNSSAHDNRGSGIHVAGGCVVDNCTATNNDLNGFQADDKSSFHQCSARGNGGSGFLTNDGCLIHACQASANGEKGIVVQRGAKVLDCVSSENGSHGIIIGDSGGRSEIRDSISENNQGAGIAIGGGSGSRLDGNQSVANSLEGYRVPAPITGNIIIRNTAQGNGTGDYPINPGNAFGPIVNVAGVGDISAIADPNHNHPWANFVF